MPAEYCQKAGLHFLLPDPFADGRRNLVEALATRRDFKGVH
jgi:hypothetical protein